MSNLQIEIRYRVIWMHGEYLRINIGYLSLDGARITTAVGDVVPIKSPLGEQVAEVIEIMEDEMLVKLVGSPESYAE